MAYWAPWWGFNKARYRVQLTSSSTPLSSADLKQRILHALLHTLESTSEPRLRTAVLMALGRLVEAGADTKLVSLLLGATQSETSEVRLSATLALGISATPLGVSILIRMLVGPTEDEQTEAAPPAERAFALALIGSKTDDEALRRTITSALMTTSEAADSVDLDLT